MQNNEPKTEYDFTVEDVRSLLNYNKETGEFIWQERPPDTPANKSFNKRFAGSVAGGFSDGEGVGYLRIRIKGQMVKAHRLAFAIVTGRFPSGYIDHINGDIQDNRWCNLREVDKVSNGRNQKLYTINTSGYSGVSWKKRDQRWYVQIGSGESREFLGSFKCKLDAIAARMRRERELNYHENHGRTT